MGFDMHEVEHLAADLTAAPAKVAAGSVRVVQDVTEQTARDAREFAPVLTGELREMIHAESHGLSGTVTSESDHGGYVEHGTSDTPAQPYMRPAAELNTPRLADGLGDVGEDIL